MNFDDDPQEATYRATVRAWIEANAPDMAALAPEERRNWHDAHKEVARKWQATKADAGYACISWPKERGGAGGTAIEEAIFNQEEARAGVQFTYFMTGLHMLLPALMEHSTDETSLARVPPAVRGEEIWCQLFSEPSSGSDSAATRTMAVLDGDDWVINGQKVWNSGAQAADYGMIIARTDPSVPKHKGLSAFWVDMKAPGIEVRPIKMMSGDSELNEVFLSDVRIPDNQRIGAPGDGWKVVISTLMNERAALGSGTGLSWRDIVEIARNSPAFDGSTLEDPAFREWLADYYVNAEAIRLLSFRLLTSLSKGHTPGPEGSAGKLLWATQTQELTNQALDIQGHFGLIDDPGTALINGAFQHRFSVGARSAAGRRNRRDHEEHHCGTGSWPAGRRPRRQDRAVSRYSDREMTPMQMSGATNPATDRGFSTLPIPFGWFGVAMSDEIEVGQVKTLDYFAQQFVIWRGEDGQVRALDPYCPHLGAHLGVNSSIKGNDLQCAFHHWTFNGEGQVTDIPYSNVIPPRLKRQCQPNWPVEEADGVIYVWYHPEKAAPKWEIARLPDCPDGEWTLAESHDWIVNTHVQEITENGQDYAHFNAVHGVQGPAAGEFEMDGWGRRNKIVAQMVTPRGPMTGIIDVNSLGPGQSIVEYIDVSHVVQSQQVTPIDSEHTHIRWQMFHPPGISDGKLRVTTARIRDLVKQINQDIPIWNSKRYRTDPILVKGDGPMLAYRRAYQRFYDFAA